MMKETLILRVCCRNASGGQEGVLFDPPVSQQGALCDPAYSLSKAQGGDNAKFNIRLEVSCEGLPPAGPLDELQVTYSNRIYFIH